MNIRYLLIFLFSGIHVLVAQNTEILGKLQNPQKEAIPFANVVLYSADTTLITGATTDIDGNFLLKSSQGKYLLKFSFLSYSEVWQSISIAENQKVLKLGTVTMQEETKSLQEVEIVAEKSNMELKLDKRVFNVEQDLANIGGDASDVLNNVPSVDVDADGNISLRGSGGVRILIDGRQSGLVADGTADALRQIPAELIDRVEVITNPSARYDAEGQVGIINIVLKKERKNGFNGSVTARTGWPHNHGLNLNLNWRRKKVNYFLTTGVNYRNSIGRGLSNQDFFFPDSAYSFDRDIHRTRGGLSENVRGGIDWKIGQNSILTSSVLYSYSNANNRAETVYKDYVGLSETLLRTSERIDRENEKEHTVEYALNFLHNFKGNKDHKLTADVTFINSDDRETSNISEGDILLSEPSINQRVSNLEFERNFVAQADYVYPFSKEGKFEAGFKSSLRSLENDFLVEDLQDGIWSPLEPFNNNFIYTENIHAAYLMGGNAFGNFSTQVGVRAEYSDIKTELVENQEINPRKYLNFFPTAHLSYKLNEFNSVQLSYARRIRRPSFWNLMPFLNYSDSRNFFSGNPNLDPQYTDAYEASYLKFTEKGSIFTSVYYRRTTNNIQRITTVDSTGFTRFFPINAGIENSYGVEFTASRKFGEKFNVNGNLNVFQFNSAGVVEGQRLTASATTANARVVTRYNINKETATQLSMRYVAPTRNLQGNVKAIYTLDYSFSKELFNKKATLSFNINDVLNSGKRRRETFGQYFESYNEYQRRVRQFTLSFTYRINQNKRNERGSKEDFMGGNEDMGE